MDAAIYSLRQEHERAKREVDELRASHADLLREAAQAQHAIDSAQREADQYAEAVTLLEEAQKARQVEA